MMFWLLIPYPRLFFAQRYGNRLPSEIYGHGKIEHDVSGKETY